MTNDKALEAARQAIRYLSHPETPWSDEQVQAVISAYLSALPGEAEVVAWRGDDAGGGRKFTAMSRVSEIWADQCLIVTPLVTLASFQAMQARALAAERERDALRTIISECASALPNGAFISPQASLEFMAMLPAEIASVCSTLTGGSNG